MPYTRSISLVPRPSPSFPLLAVRLLQATGWPGKEASSACCEHLPEQQAGSSLLFTSVVFYKSTALLYGRQQTGNKSAINQKKCVFANVLLLYSK